MRKTGLNLWIYWGTYRISNWVVWLFTSLYIT